MRAEDDKANNLKGKKKAACGAARFISQALAFPLVDHVLVSRGSRLPTSSFQPAYSRTHSMQQSIANQELYQYPGSSRDMTTIPRRARSAISILRG